MLDFDDPTREKIAEAAKDIDGATIDSGVRLACLAPGHNRLAVVLGAGKVNTPQENQILARCRVLLEKHKIKKAVAIIWDPPLSTKRVRTFIVET